MFDRDLFIYDVRTLAEQGIPFIHQGYNAETGSDCINLPRIAYENQQPLPEELRKEFDSYHEVPDGLKLLMIMRQWFEEIPESEAQPGDLYILYARRNPCHLAVRLDDNDPPTMAEAYKSLDGSIQKTLVWPLDQRRRIVTVFRIPDFA